MANNTAHQNRPPHSLDLTKPPASPHLSLPQHHHHHHPPPIGLLQSFDPIPRTSPSPPPVYGLCSSSLEPSFASSRLPSVACLESAAWFFFSIFFVSSWGCLFLSSLALLSLSLRFVLCDVFVRCSGSGSDDAVSFYCFCCHCG